MGLLSPQKDSALSDLKPATFFLTGGPVNTFSFAFDILNSKQFFLNLKEFLEQTQYDIRNQRKKLRRMMYVSEFSQAEDLWITNGVSARGAPIPSPTKSNSWTWLDLAGLGIGIGWTWNWTWNWNWLDLDLVGLGSTWLDLIGLDMELNRISHSCLRFL